MTVKQMLNALTSRELTEWIAFYNHEAEMQKESMIRADLERKLRG